MTTGGSRRWPPAPFPGQGPDEVQPLTQRAQQPCSPPLRAILKLTYRCTNRCRFCRVDGHRGVVEDMPLERAVALLHEARRLGVEMILFSGGEPTLRSDLPRLARVARTLGLRWGLITNARRLAYPEYREALLSLGLCYVHTSLHGARAETHDHLVQCSGYEDVLQVLRGLEGSGVEVHVNTVITQLNLSELDAISGLLASLWRQENSCGIPLTHKLCLMEPRGLFEAHEQELIVRPEIAARVAVAAARRARERYPGAALRTEVEGFPHCQVPPDLAAGLHTHNIRFMCEGFEDRFHPTDHGPRTFPPPCSRCSARPSCPGVYIGYAERFGAAGLTPIRAPRRRKNPGTRRPRAD